MANGRTELAKLKTESDEAIPCRRRIKGTLTRDPMVLGPHEGGTYTVNLTLVVIERREKRRTLTLHWPIESIEALEEVPWREFLEGDLVKARVHPEIQAEHQVNLVVDSVEAAEGRWARARRRKHKARRALKQVQIMERAAKPKHLPKGGAEAS